MSTQVKTIALTGASGFVGRHILSQLLDAGHQVRALVRDPGQLQMNSSAVCVVEGDLFDDAALTSLVASADAVIHVVGIIMEDRKHGQTFERVHVEGTRNLLKAAKANRAANESGGGVRKWVHMSALGARPHAPSVYHATKWQGEQLVRASGLDFTIFRPSIIHGPDGEFMQMVKSFWCKLFPPFVPYFGAGLMAGHARFALCGLSWCGYTRKILIRKINQ